MSYSRPTYSSEKLKVYKNGKTFNVDRMDVDTSGIWYRRTEDKTWVMYRTSSGKTYLKIMENMKNKVSTNKTPTSTSNKRKTNNSNTSTGNSDVELISLPPSSELNGKSLILPSGTEVVTDVIQQNGCNYPPVSKTDNSTGDIWYDWTINTDELKQSVLSIKRNLNAANAYSRLELARLTHTKFNRYKIDFGDYRLKPTISYAVFTRPDLNLFDENKNILPQISNDPQLYYIWKTNPIILKQLSLNFSGTHKFIPLLTNQITALDIIDESLDTTEVGENFAGFKMQYAKHSNRSMTSGTISVKFPETMDLSITHMIQTWCSYESGVYRGILTPKDDYCMYKILDYACNIYYFLMDSEFTIRFWSVYYGAFPTNVNKSIFSYDMGSNSGMSDVNVTFAYFHKEDLDTRSLVDFNNLGGGVPAGTKYRLDTDARMCLGGGGSTWSGAPFVDTVKTFNGIDTVDEFKLRFRTV